MIDWLTVHVDLVESDAAAWAAFCARRWPGWQRVEAGGECAGVRWDFQRLRSDSREVTVLPTGSGFVAMGSPSIALGLGNNVFGPSDFGVCLRALVDAAFSGLEQGGWSGGRERVSRVRVSRADVTFNVLLPDSAHVAALLRGVDGIETGRYRTGRKYGTTVYLGGKSRRRRSKIYSKGAHIRQLLKKGKVVGISESDLTLLDRVARLELEFGRDYWRGREWQEACEGLEAAAVEYWAKLWGDVGGVDVDAADVERVVAAADGNTRVGRAAYRTLCLIRSQGRASAELTVSRATWFRHQRILRSAGFGEAELHGTCQVYRFPVREVLASRVDSWEALRRAA